MKCKNCNGEIPESARFCPVCGEKCDAAEPVTEENISGEELQPETASREAAMEEEARPGTGSVETASEENVQGSYMSFEPSAEAAPMKPKKGKKVAAIIAAVIVVLAVGIGVTSYAKISNFVKKSFSSPASYYQYVEKKNRDEQSKVLMGCYDVMRSNATTSEPQNTSYKLEIGQSLKTMLSMTGMDFSAFNNLEVNVNGKMAEDIMSAQLKGRINDADVITLNMYMDYAKKEGFFQMPELSPKYLDFTKVMQDEEMEETISQLKKISVLNQYFPETRQIKSLIETYSDLFIDDMDSVEKSSADLEAGGIKANYTDLKVTCKGKKLAGIAKKIMTTMKDDQNLKAIIENIDQEAYAEFTNSLAEEMENLETLDGKVKDEDLQMVMDVYVDGEGTIVGRVLEVKVEEKENVKITCIEPQKGSEFGSTLSLEYNGVNYFTLSGKGTRKGGKISGDYTVSMDDSLNPSEDVITSMKDFLTIKITDLDEDSLEEEGCLNGTFKFSSQAIASFTSYEIQLDCQGDKNGITQSLSVICGGDKLATLTAVSKKGEEPAVTKPGEGSEICDASDPEGMAAYTKELDPTKLLDSIKEKCGVDLSSYMSMLESLLGGDDEEYDTEDYDIEGYELDENDLDIYDTDEDINYDVDGESLDEGL